MASAAPTTPKPRLVRSALTWAASPVAPDPFWTWTLTWDGAVSSTGVVAGLPGLLARRGFFAWGKGVAGAMAGNRSPASGAADSTAPPRSAGLATWVAG